VAIQIQGNSGVIQEVGGTTFRAGNVHIKPLEYAALGHYRTSVKLTMATSQAANSRLFELRNTHATNLIVLTRCIVGFLPTGTITTPYAAELALYKCTSFTVVDTTNTVTPTTGVKRGATMAAYPGGAAVRHNTIAGAAAGMTGGTLTKDAQAAGSLICWAATAAATSIPIYQDLLNDVNGGHPYVFVQNEGFEIENVVGGSATANVAQVLIDVSWAEVSAY
jgi:hypothetical protein